MYNYAHDAPPPPSNRRLFGARAAQQEDDAGAGVLEVLSSMIQVREGEVGLFARSCMPSYISRVGWMVGYALFAACPSVPADPKTLITRTEGLARRVRPARRRRQHHRALRRLGSRRRGHRRGRRATISRRGGGQRRWWWWS